MIAFDRICKVTVFRQPTGFVGAHPTYFDVLENAVEVTGTRIRFTVEKNLDAEPNKAEVTISNLSERSRAEFQTLPLRVHLEAGHAGIAKLILAGDVLPGSYSRLEGTEWSTKLRLGDGERAFAHARVNRSYRPGTPVRVVLRDAARALGLELPRDLNGTPELAAMLSSGEVLSGYASDELTRLLAPYGFRWSIQNGRLQVLRDAQVIAGQARVLQTPPDGGILGSPTVNTPEPSKSGKETKKRPSVTIQHILDGSLAPGQLILPRARTVEGLFKIWQVKHEGDTHGAPWTSIMEVRPVSR